MRITGSALSPGLGQRSGPLLNNPAARSALPFGYGGIFHPEAAVWGRGKTQSEGTWPEISRFDVQGTLQVSPVAFLAVQEGGGFGGGKEQGYGHPTPLLRPDTRRPGQGGRDGATGGASGALHGAVTPDSSRRGRDGGGGCPPNLWGVTPGAPPPSTPSCPPVPSLPSPGEQQGRPEPAVPAATRGGGGGVPPLTSVPARPGGGRHPPRPPRPRRVAGGSGGADSPCGSGC